MWLFTISLWWNLCSLSWVQFSKLFLSLISWLHFYTLHVEFHRSCVCFIYLAAQWCGNKEQYQSFVWKLCMCSSTGGLNGWVLPVSCLLPHRPPTTWAWYEMNCSMLTCPLVRGSHPHLRFPSMYQPALSHLSCFKVSEQLTLYSFQRAPINL